MPLKVIGAGFPRTGTASLKEALNYLGFGPCYHMSEVALEHGPLWMAAFDGDTSHWEEIFKDYASTTDAPGCHFYAELAKAYPDAKVILSVRDPDAWFRSTQETVLSPAVAQMFAAHPPSSQMFMRRMGWHPGDAETHDKERMIARLKAHEDEVKRTIPPQRLLVFNVAEGWAPLCAFLGVPVPDVAFPHINSSEDFRRMISGAGSEMSPQKAGEALAREAERQRKGR
jgi:hypothetical protein